MGGPLEVSQGRTGKSREGGAGQKRAGEAAHGLKHHPVGPVQQAGSAQGPGRGLTPLGAGDSTGGTGEPCWQDPSSPTPFSVGSPPKFSSTYQSDSHSQCGEGSATPSSGRCWSPLTSLHGQRSLGRSASQKPPTGFQRWGPEAETGLRPVWQGPLRGQQGPHLLSRTGREQRATRTAPLRAETCRPRGRGGTAVLSSQNPSLCRPGRGLAAVAWLLHPDLSRVKETGGNQPGVGCRAVSRPPRYPLDPPDSHRPPPGSGWGRRWHPQAHTPDGHRRCPSSSPWPR